MAAYVRIQKLSEDPAVARYSFSTDDRAFGKVSFDKQSGTAKLDEGLDGDANDANFWRAAAKLRKEWQAGRMPDFTEFAS